MGALVPKYKTNKNHILKKSIDFLQGHWGISFINTVLGVSETAQQVIISVAKTDDLNQSPGIIQ